MLISNYNALNLAKKGQYNGTKLNLKFLKSQNTSMVNMISNYRILILIGQTYSQLRSIHLQYLNCIYTNNYNYKDSFLYLY